MRISYSALDTYKNCPLKYKYQELDRIAVPKNIEAVFGGSIHACLKFMFERTPLYPTADEIINLFRNLWSIKKEKINLSEEELKAYCDDGISILKNFYKLNQPWNFNVLDLESRFSVLIPDPSGKEEHILTGIIDRIDKNPDNEFYEIIDYKTSRKMPSQENLDKNLQMSIYQMGILKRWPHIKPENIKLSFYFLKHGEKITTSRSPEDLEKTKTFIIKTVGEIKKRIADNDFSPFPSGLCNWCGYKPQCPMWKHQFSNLSAKGGKTQNDIELIIKEYFDLKGQNIKNNKRLTELQGIVYEFMNQENVERIFGENGYLTKVLQERLVCDMEKVKKILEEIGKWNEVAKKKQYFSLKAFRQKRGSP